MPCAIYPAPAHLDPPNAGGAVEVEEPAKVAAGTLLYVEMEVQVHFLLSAAQRVRVVWGKVGGEMQKGISGQVLRVQLDGKGSSLSPAQQVRVGGVAEGGEKATDLGGKLLRVQIRFLVSLFPLLPSLACAQVRKELLRLR